MLCGRLTCDVPDSPDGATEMKVNSNAEMMRSTDLDPTSPEDVMDAADTHGVDYDGCIRLGGLPSFELGARR